MSGRPPGGAAGKAWWGRFEVPAGERRHFRIGPCALWFERAPREWRVSCKTYGDPLDPSLVVADPHSAPPAPAAEREGLTVQRFATSGSDHYLTLRPRLADRPVVVQAFEPFALMAGDTTTLYVSTAVWVAASSGEPSTTLLDLATQRPSDSWFGADTREGQLCYASRTSARLELGEVPLRPGRCITPLRLHNRASDALVLDRVSVPVPYLSVFATESARLFTETIELVRQSDATVTGVTILDAPPAAVGPATRLSEPRAGQQSGLLAKAFNALLS